MRYTIHIMPDYIWICPWKWKIFLKEDTNANEYSFVILLVIRVIQKHSWKHPVNRQPTLFRQNLFLTLVHSLGLNTSQILQCCTILIQCTCNWKRYRYILYNDYCRFSLTRMYISITEWAFTLLLFPNLICIRWICPHRSLKNCFLSNTSRTYMHFLPCFCFKED